MFSRQGVKEIQFEINGYGRYSWAEKATAYIILKDNPEPRLLFSIIAAQKEFAMASKTHAFDYCTDVLKVIEDKYKIPAIYKQSIETKQKSKAIFLVFILLIFIPIMIWLRVKLGK